MEKFQLSNENLAKVILYHEVMWDMMDILVNKKIITQPDILKGSNHVKQRDFGQIVYMVEFRASLPCGAIRKKHRNQLIYDALTS